MVKRLIIIVLVLLLLAVWVRITDAGDRTLEQRVADLEDQNALLEREIALNMIGDCINENILRQVLGAPVATFEECVQERVTWSQPKPEPTPAPTSF